MNSPTFCLGYEIDPDCRALKAQLIDEITRFDTQLFTEIIRPKKSLDELTAREKRELIDNHFFKRESANLEPDRLLLQNLQDFNLVATKSKGNNVTVNTLYFEHKKIAENTHKYQEKLMPDGSNEIINSCITQIKSLNFDEVFKKLQPPPVKQDLIAESWKDSLAVYNNAIENKLNEYKKEFLAAHAKQLKQDQRFSLFNPFSFMHRTKLKDDMSFKQIIEHAIKNESSRSRAIFEKLGWLKEDGKWGDKCPMLVCGEVDNRFSSKVKDIEALHTKLKKGSAGILLTYGKKVTFSHRAEVKENQQFQELGWASELGLTKDAPKCIHDLMALNKTELYKAAISNKNSSSDMDRESSSDEIASISSTTFVRNR